MEDIMPHVMQSIALIGIAFIVIAGIILRKVVKKAERIEQIWGPPEISKVRVHKVFQENPFGYRDLVPSVDLIALGDEWYNPEWEIAGPWYVVEPGNVHVGQLYVGGFRRMRRPLEEGEKE